MTSVLMTFETPFCVFVREVEFNMADWFAKEMACTNSGFWKRASGGKAWKLIPYHPRPGSAAAIGHWSLLSDAGWRERNA